MSNIYNKYKEEEIEKYLKAFTVNLRHVYRELLLRYKNTFAMVQGELFKIVDIGLAENHIEIYCESSTKKQLWNKKLSFTWKEGAVTPFMPESRLYNLYHDRFNYGHTIYLYKRPYRQHRKSFNEDMYRLHDPYFNFIDFINQNDILSPKIFNVINKEEPLPSFEESLKLVTSLKYISCAFTKSYYVGASEESRPIVGYKTFGPCGTVDDNGIVLLNKDSHHLFEELSTYTNCRRI